MAKIDEIVMMRIMMATLAILGIGIAGMFWYLAEVA
jgi:hypothetical protein